MTRPRKEIPCAISPSPFSLTLGPLGAFPGPRKPRVLWAGVTGELAPLRALQMDLATRFEAIGLVLEARTYTPHLTLAREPLAPVNGAAVAQAVPVPPVSWRVEHVTLFQSQLGPGGAVHMPLAEPRLGPG